ncbi:glycosyltransferase [Flavobacterium sp. LB3P45]|uniref:Glycosyltransferase n=1 Tax=Flavobacterium fructosi TaxID=3230416 RepID=A0ABW6HLU9_9FLAO
MRILFCGKSGYPSSNNAAINRYSSIAKVMSYENDIIFINRIPLLENNCVYNKTEFKVIAASYHKYRPKNFLKRNFIKLFSPMFEFGTIWSLNKEKKIDWVNVYTDYFGLCLFYFILSKIFRFKTILHFVEIRSEFKNQNLFLKINHFLYDNFSMFLFDRYLPISRFLDEHLKNKNSNIKALIIPPICDFDYFKKINIPNEFNETYFLYCGSTAYSEVIVFIIDSFEKVRQEKSVNLYLVLNGIVPDELKVLLEQKRERIKVFSNLDYNKLIGLYKSALALLIPLRDTEQDKARFPQKICEYIASEKIIISTNYGEVKHYFEDMNNALIADEYNEEIYAKKMEWVVHNISNLNELEGAAYKTGKKYFDIISYKESINDLLKG